MRVVDFPGTRAYWLENPGPTAAGSAWASHPVLAAVDTGSPTYTDITGDGVPESVAGYGGYLGWATPDPSDPTLPWVFRRASAEGQYRASSTGSVSAAARCSRSMWTATGTARS